MKSWTADKRLVGAVNCIVAVLLLSLLSCTAGGSKPAGLPAPVSGPADLAQLLPPVPQTLQAARHASYNNVLFSYGNAIFNSSDGSIFAGNSIVLPSQPDGLEYALYAFNAAGYQPHRLDVGIKAGTNSVAWVGIADFNQGGWDFRGPFNGPAQITLPAGDYNSELNQCYVAVVAYGGASATNDFVMLTYDDLVSTDYSISGTLLDENGAPIPGNLVSLSPGATSRYTDTQGNYFFGIEAAGDYTVTPDDLHFSMLPPNAMVTVDGHETGVDFTGTRIDISGTITMEGGAALPGVLLTLNPGGATTYSGGDGGYLFDGVADGNYTVTPLLATYDFAPTSENANVSGADVTGIDFTATGGQPTYYIYGLIRDGSLNPVPGVVVVLNPGYLIAITNSSGEFTFYNLSNGDYTLEPGLGLWSFSPPSRNITINDANFVTADFDATPPPPTYSVLGKVVNDYGGPAFNYGMPSFDLLLYRETGSGYDLLQYVETDNAGDYALPPLPDGDYYLQENSFPFTTTPTAHFFTVNGANVNLPEMKATFASGGPSWENFGAAFVSDWCIQCHRPDSATAVNPYLRTLTEVKNAGGACNFDIQNDIMPPGYTLLPIYKHYFDEWTNLDFPEE